VKTFAERVVADLNRRGGTLRWTLRRQRWPTTRLPSGRTFYAAPDNASAAGWAAYTCTAMTRDEHEDLRFVGYTHSLGEAATDPRNVADRIVVLVRRAMGEQVDILGF
jgi:hypothetical protein